MQNLDADFDRGADPGPTPHEASAMLWAQIDERSQRFRNEGARRLAAFCRDTAANFATPKGDERTNIIDQGERMTYCFGPDQYRRLFEELEACRLEGSTTHFSERQGTVAEPRSGIMVDFDIVTTQQRPAVTDRHWNRLATALLALLQRDIDIAAQIPCGPNGAPLAEWPVHVFFIVKPETVPLLGASPAAGASASPNASASTSAGAALKYKYGFHILVPGLRLPRSYKKYLLREYRTDRAVLATLAELGALAPEDCLDMNSASVPVLFFGSCKRGGTPYVLGGALEAVLDLGAGYASPPAIRKLSREDLGQAAAGPAAAPLKGKTLAAQLARAQAEASAPPRYNLVAELGLNREAAYDGRPPLVRKIDFDPRPGVAALSEDWAMRQAGGAIAPAELLAAEHTLSTLTLHDAEARHLHALLDLLGPEYSSDRNRWRNVVYALANTSAQYKPLAVWFSHRCPRKWADGGSDSLDALWEEAVAAKGATGAAPLTLRSINYWARTSDPERYALTMEKSYFQTLTEYVYEHGGTLEHYMVAKVLHAMLSAKFCVDVEPGSRGAVYAWYEFVLPGQSMAAGQVWKWRREASPDDIHIYMSEKLPRVMDQVAEHLEERRAAAAGEQQALYYKNLATKFALSKKSLFNDGFKHKVISQAEFLFRRRGFYEKLDRLPDLFGVGNGVLVLGPKCRLVDSYHEWPISRGTQVAWRPFDAEEPWTRMALDAIAAIIPEPDARDWILFHAAQGLSGAPKEGLFLMWEGGGQNGKTSFLRWVAKALGPYADKFNIQLMCCEREDADRPNSAVMRFKYLNWAYAEESNHAQRLNPARMKELVSPGEVSGRELNTRQETFTMHANMVAASQYSFIVETTDHGTWRRIRSYLSKTKFRKYPDPNNPYEQLEDQRFVEDYPDNPQWQSAILSILTHYYERLQTEHGGKLKNVNSPTIERETEVFRVEQDTLHRWICQSVVISPKSTEEYLLSDLCGHFTDWYNRNVARKFHVVADVIKQIEMTAICKYLKPGAHGQLYLRGCRLINIQDADPDLHPGEEFLTAVEMRGSKSKAEWDAACAAAAELRTEGKKWWEPQAARAAADEGADPDEWLATDDDALMRALREERLAASKVPARAAPAAVAAPTAAEVEEEMQRLLAAPAEGAADGAARPGTGRVYHGGKNSLLDELYDE